MTSYKAMTKILYGKTLKKGFSNAKKMIPSFPAAILSDMVTMIAGKPAVIT